MAYASHPKGKFLPNPKLKLREQLGEVMRFKQMSGRTEESYVDWIRRFIVWSGKRHPREMGTDDDVTGEFEGRVEGASASCAGVA